MGEDGDGEGEVSYHTEYFYDPTTFFLLFLVGDWCLLPFFLFLCSFSFFSLFSMAFWSMGY